MEAEAGGCYNVRILKLPHRRCVILLLYIHFEISPPHLRLPQNDVSICANSTEHRSSFKTVHHPRFSVSRISDVDVMVYSSRGDIACYKTQNEDVSN